MGYFKNREPSTINEYIYKLGFTEYTEDLTWYNDSYLDMPIPQGHLLFLKDVAFFCITIVRINIQGRTAGVYRLRQYGNLTFVEICKRCIIPKECSEDLKLFKEWLYDTLDVYTGSCIDL